MALLILSDTSEPDQSDVATTRGYAEPDHIMSPGLKPEKTAVFERGSAKPMPSKDIEHPVPFMMRAPPVNRRTPSAVIRRCSLHIVSLEIVRIAYPELVFPLGTETGRAYICPHSIDAQTKSPTLIESILLIRFTKSMALLTHRILLSPRSAGCE